MLIKNFNEQPKTSYSSRRKKGIDFRSTILTERFLSMMLKVISNPDFGKVKKLQNIQTFVNSTPSYLFEKDPSLNALMISIKCVLRNKLEGASEPQDLVEYVNIDLGDQFNEIKENIIYPTILSASEATEKETKLVTRTCDKLLRYEAILIRKDDLADAITDIGSGNISNLDDAIQELRNIIADLNEEFSKTDSLDGELSVFHTTRPDEFKEKFEESYDYENSPKMCLHLGLKMLDKMISPRGGLLGGTFNLFMADTNTFKSALLEYIKNWIRKYNSDMFKEEFLKTGKRPTILFVSLENGSKEDVSRDFSIMSKHNMYEYENVDAAFQAFQQTTNDSIIDVTQVNAGDYKVNLSTIKQLIRRLEEDDYFVIAVIVDSFDLMSPSESDIALRVNDETTILLNRAREIEKWISDKPYPIVSCHQLNRQAAQTISEQKQKGAVDLCKFLDRQHVSGSYDILRRAHFTAFIYVEISKYDGEKYLEIRRDKTRYRASGDEYSYLVTKLNNGFFIDDDYGTDKESCRASIIPTEEAFGSGISVMGMNVGQRGLTQLPQKPVAVPKNAHVVNASPVTQQPKKNLNSPIKTMTFGGSNTDSVQETYPLAMYNPIFMQMQFFMTMAQQLGSIKGFTPFDNKNKDVEIQVEDSGDVYFYDPRNAVTPFDKLQGEN